MNDPELSSSETDLVGRAREAFRFCFDRGATVVALAPGRVNLIGEHTDYNEGFVLPMAIDRQACMVAAPASGASGTLLAVDLDEKTTIDWSIAVSPVEQRWANYPLGVVAQFHARGVSIPALDLALISDISIGAGLSSSAAIEVATASLLEVVLDESLGATEKARLCQRAEHTFAGTPCGIMDMLIATQAQAGRAMLIDCRDDRCAPVDLPADDEIAVLMVDTKVKHDLASSEYAERRATCADVARKIGLPSLRDATLGMLEGSDITDTERKRASHVIMESTRTLLAAQALQEGELVTFGDLMFASHQSLRELYAVSCPELDTIVDTARAMREARMHGVIGARMTGGGFGGCAIVIAHAHSLDTLRDTIIGRFKAAHGDLPDVERVRAAGATQAWRLNEP